MTNDPFKGDTSLRNHVRAGARIVIVLLRHLQKSGFNILSDPTEWPSPFAPTHPHRRGTTTRGAKTNGDATSTRKRALLLGTTVHVETYEAHGSSNGVHQ
ncbi:hypothetical protein TNCT_8041 [Trichonephila clavata]|uniref:Uncharacterized protein n=1 Tax=Trichonephila clavata TaxID=2740835 RepID=A0A8X6HQW4_TRICU|nr:hypothetical protein TNCT_8041 [Trichonephila clavata]